jgi:pSer/pThr/pTyr-binding forkhead associated (FHA) protein
VNEPVPQPQPQPQPEPAGDEGPRVLVIRDHQLVREVRLTGPLSIGRKPDNDLVIDDEQVSGYHGRIERVGPGWRYTDLGSTNGSIVSAGPTLHAQQSLPLVEDVQILLGSTVLDVRVQDPHATEEVKLAPAASLHPRVVLRGERGLQRLPVPEPSAVLGRGEGADVDIAHASVSQRHCQIRREGTGFVVQDLGSTNGTRLGLQKLSGPRPLPSGSQLILGEADLLFVHDGGRQPEPEAILAKLRAKRRLSRANEAAARRELAAGRSLGEALVLVGALTPGQWVELAAGAHVGRDEGGRRRRRNRLRAWLAAVLVALLAVLAWMLFRLR